MTAVHPLLQETRDFFVAPLAGRSADQVAQRPGSDTARWNARQVVEHLLLTWRLTTDGIDARLQKGRPLLSRPTMAQHCMQFAVCELGYFPKGRKAPAPVQPGPETTEPVSGDELIARMNEALAAMDSMLNRIEPEAKGAVVLTHVTLGPMTVRRWRRFHRTHAKHHVAQMGDAMLYAAPLITE